MKATLSIQLEKGDYAYVDVEYKFINQDFEDLHESELEQVDNIDLYDISSITHTDKEVNRQIKKYYEDLKLELIEQL